MSKSLVFEGCTGYNENDKDIIEHILRYCIQIETAHQDFGCSKERFEQSTTYQNAMVMCILQIGEQVNRLSDSFKNELLLRGEAEDHAHEGKLMEAIANAHVLH